LTRLGARLDEALSQGREGRAVAGKENTMKVKALQVRNTIFWSLIAIFAVLVAAIVTGRGRRLGFVMPFSAMIVLAAAFVVLAVVLVIITAKLRESGIQKSFFIVTGASAALMPIFAILHNLVYALCIKLGWGFGGTGGDEAVFFILAILVCPALFVLGAMGSIVFLVSAMLRKKES